MNGVNYKTNFIINCKAIEVVSVKGIETKETTVDCMIFFNEIQMIKEDRLNSQRSLVFIKNRKKPVVVLSPVDFFYNEFKKYCC